jgi:hypothetical protein
VRNGFGREITLRWKSLLTIHDPKSVSQPKMKTPGGLAGGVSFPGLKIETWGTQIGVDAVGA